MTNEPMMTVTCVECHATETLPILARSEVIHAIVHQTGRCLKCGSAKLSFREIVRTAGALLFVAVLASACSVPAPTAPITPQPVAGVAARLELSSAAGIGVAGGSASLAARVLDAYATPVQNAIVTFQTTVGDVAPATVMTDVAGTARALLTAPAGLTTITVSTGNVQTTLPIVVQPVTTPTPVPPVTPQPPPTEPDPMVSLSARWLSPLAYRFTLTLSGPAVVRDIAYTFQSRSALDDVVVHTTARTIDHTFAAAGVTPVTADVTLANGHVVSTSVQLFVQVQP